MYLEFQFYLVYNAYQSKFKWLKYKFINYKYHKILDLIREQNSLTRKKRKFYLLKYKKKQMIKINNYLYLYKFFFFMIFVDIFYFVKKNKLKRQKLTHFLILSFINNKLFVNLLNLNKKNYLFLSSGLFIKFFEKKKSFKKNKIIKLLIAKYLRKIFLLTKIRNTSLIIKNNPTFLLEMITFLNSPIPHKFMDPVTEEIIEELTPNFTWIKFLYFIFLENSSFSNNKTKKIGRIKRKITRKLVITNRVVD